METTHIFFICVTLFLSFSGYMFGYFSGKRSGYSDGYDDGYDDGYAKGIKVKPLGEEEKEAMVNKIVREIQELQKRERLTDKEKYAQIINGLQKKSLEKV